MKETSAKKNTLWNSLGVWLVAAGIGLFNAVLLYCFEFIGIDVTAWLWNDVLHTDNPAYRWVLIPVVAVVLSIILSFVIKSLREKRIVAVNTDLMEEVSDPNAPSTLKALGVVLAVGGASLLAGASLGPEAPLMASSIIIGSWAVRKFKLTPAKQLIIFTSIGALLVAFLGSLILGLIPLLMLWQKKALTLKSGAVVVLASLISYATIAFIDHESPGYGTTPVTVVDVSGHDFWVAAVVGFVTSLIALLLTLFIKQFAKIAAWIDGRVPWYVSAGIFGLILGLIYLLGNQTTEFSGSIGTQLLVSEAAQFGMVTLIILIGAKLLATSWSTASGYRGGLVFPSIYIGVALGLLVGVLFPEIGGVGAMLGGVAGVISAVIGSPVMAAIFVAGAIPFAELFKNPSLFLIALCAIAGTIVFSLIKKALFARKSA